MYTLSRARFKCLLLLAIAERRRWQKGTVIDGVSVGGRWKPKFGSGGGNSESVDMSAVVGAFDAAMASSKRDILNQIPSHLQQVEVSSNRVEIADLALEAIAKQVDDSQESLFGQVREFVGEKLSSGVKSLGQAFDRASTVALEAVRAIGENPVETALVVGSVSAAWLATDLLLAGTFAAIGLLILTGVKVAAPPGSDWLKSKGDGRSRYFGIWLVQICSVNCPIGYLRNLLKGFNHICRLSAIAALQQKGVR